MNAMTAVVRTSFTLILRSISSSGRIMMGGSSGSLPSSSSESSISCASGIHSFHAILKFSSSVSVRDIVILRSKSAMLSCILALPRSGFPVGLLAFCWFFVACLWKNTDIFCWCLRISASRLRVSALRFLCRSRMPSGCIMMREVYGLLSEVRLNPNPNPATGATPCTTDGPRCYRQVGAGPCAGGTAVAASAGRSRLEPAPPLRRVTLQPRVGQFSRPSARPRRHRRRRNAFGDNAVPPGTLGADDTHTLGPV
mmetsp:Transcript_11088/g.33708  ORF Transcript_11088/g.33708 Transcript_11088/m.33708 type:complete len:254 (+) Transcript_11088:340-1101(+)